MSWEIDCQNGSVTFPRRSNGHDFAVVEAGLQGEVQSDTIPIG
jgi:hypothetical protein